MKPRNRVAIVVACTLPLVGIALLLIGAKTDPMRVGKPELRSIGALAFGPDGVLVAGDSIGGAVVAIDVGAGSGSSGDWPRGTWTDWVAVADLDAKLAAMLGTTPRDVFIRDLAYHAPSRSAYLSIMRGGGKDALPVLMRVSAGGEIAQVSLDEVRYAALEIRDAPAPDAADRYGRPRRTFTITDLEFVDGELFIAGLSNEEFASTLRRVPYPFTGEPSATGVEIYHGNHGAWETHAPILTFLPFELEGESHLLASYVCTPLVTLPTRALVDGGKVRGKTIAELGWGNTPVDMISYEYKGQEIVLLANNQRGTMIFAAADIRAANQRNGITHKAADGTGIDWRAAPLGHVVQLTDMEDERVLFLARDPANGALSLFARRKDLL